MTDKADKDKKDKTDKADKKIDPPEETILEKTDPEKIVRNHIIGAMAIGLIPIPLADMAALTGIQLNMLRKLGNAYDVPFSKDTGKNIIASLVGGSIPAFSSGALASFVKTVPIVGQTIGVLTMPALAGATTYAIGKVFIQHFASGGTFLNFDPDQVRDYYAEMLKEGNKVATDMK
jgi:uncharacterized protein (DUF697 family)